MLPTSPSSNTAHQYFCHLPPWHPKYRTWVLSLRLKRPDSLTGSCFCRWGKKKSHPASGKQAPLLSYHTCYLLMWLVPTPDVPSTLHRPSPCRPQCRAPWGLGWVLGCPTLDSRKLNPQRYYQDDHCLFSNRILPQPTSSIFSLSVGKRRQLDDLFSPRGDGSKHCAVDPVIHTWCSGHAPRAHCSSSGPPCTFLPRSGRHSQGPHGLCTEHWIRSPPLTGWPSPPVSEILLSYPFLREP